MTTNSIYGHDSGIGISFIDVADVPAMVGSILAVLPNADSGLITVTGTNVAVRLNTGSFTPRTMAELLDDLDDLAPPVTA